MDDYYDVIVVGAGLAGLSGARYLSLAGKRTLVLEARNRVGGRVLTKFQGAIPVDLGAQWIGPGQTHMYDLLASFGLKTYPTYHKGKHVLATKKRIRSYSGTIPKIGFPALLDLQNFIRKINKLSPKINIESPWTSDSAQKLDFQKFSDFVRKNTWFPSTRNFVFSGLETILGCHLSELSTLQALFYFRSGGGLESLINIHGGAQQDRVAGGMQTLAIKMANELSVLLYHPVLSIRHFKGGVEVAGSDFSYKARHVIVAIPPILARKIKFRPEIKEHKRGLWDAMPMGEVLKCYAIYDHPFWRKDGWSGQVVAHKRSPIQTAFDNSSEAHPHGILMGFSIGNRAHELMKYSEADREKKVLKTFSSFLGQKAQNPITYIEKSWFSDPWSQGAYTGYRQPGAWIRYRDALTEPAGRIHWAGTETSTVWNGYMEGAVRSGIRAAKEILLEPAR